MTEQTGKTVADTAKPIIELVEVIPMRYIVLALAVGVAATFTAMYIIGHRMESEQGTNNDGN